MGDFVKGYIATAVVLLGLLAAWLTIGQANGYWLVIFVLLGAAAVQGVPRLYVKAREAMQRITNYPRLLNALADSQESNRQGDVRIASLEQELLNRYEAGMEEGGMRLLGGALAGRVTPPPKLLSVYQRGDSVAIAANYDAGVEVRVGARFNLLVDGSDQVLGTLQVISAAPAGIATMSCVNRAVPEFWDDLEARVARDPSPPASVHLHPSEVVWPKGVSTVEDKAEVAVVEKPKERG